MEGKNTKKEKEEEFTDLDNSVVIVREGAGGGGEGYREGQW